MQNRNMADSWLDNELDEIENSEGEGQSEDRQLQEIIEKTRDDIAKVFGESNKVDVTLAN